MLFSLRSTLTKTSVVHIVTPTSLQTEDKSLAPLKAMGLMYGGPKLTSQLKISDCSISTKKNTLNKIKCKS
jgi:hypothetical protein